MGNSDGVEVGDWVEAIGEPFGLAKTVTAGIISSKNRTVEQGTAGEFQHFLQTDAAINPGNSGGPLLDMAGEVIGMNTAIYTQGAGNEGIGFAMPSNTIIDVYNDLIGPSTRSSAAASASASSPTCPAPSPASMDSNPASSSARSDPASPPPKPDSRSATSLPPSMANT